MALTRDQARQPPLTMFVYFGKRYSSVVTARRIVKVCCDKCQVEFFYELVRQGRGSASAPYYLGQESAQQRAQEAAQKAVSRKLARESDPVPCPKCNWVNEDLIQGYRRSKFKSLPVIGVLVAIGLWLIVFLAICGDGSRYVAPKYPYEIGITAATIVAVIAGGGMFWLQYQLRRRIDPNRTFPAAPIRPAAIQKAWTAEELASPAEAPSARFVPASDFGIDPYWSLFRAGHLVFPKACCECLAPPVTTYRTPFSTNHDQKPLPVPLCAECASRLKWHWWVTALLTAASVVLMSSTIYGWGHADAVGRTMMAVFIAIFGIAFGVAIIPNRVTRPYKLRTVDRARSVYRIRFRSEQFTEMVRRASADDEKAVFKGN